MKFEFERYIIYINGYQLPKVYGKKQMISIKKRFNIFANKGDEMMIQRAFRNGKFKTVAILKKKGRRLFSE